MPGQRCTNTAADPTVPQPYVGDAGKMIAIDHFGASADGKTLFTAALAGRPAP